MKEPLPHRIAGVALPLHVVVVSEALQAARRGQFARQLPRQWSTDPVTLQRVVDKFQQLPSAW